MALRRFRSTQEGRRTRILGWRFRPRCVLLSWNFVADAYRQEKGHVLTLSWQGSVLANKKYGSGLHYMRNRVYDPGTGRFTQEDPIGLAGGLNTYGFAAGDPVNRSDPFGLCPPEPPKKPCAVSLQGASVAVSWVTGSASFSRGTYTVDGKSGKYMSTSGGAAAAAGNFSLGFSISLEQGGSESLQTFEGRSVSVSVGGSAGLGTASASISTSETQPSGWSTSYGIGARALPVTAGVSFSKTTLLSPAVGLPRGPSAPADATAARVRPNQE
jgi:RHS repeat-associated protein